MNPSIATYQMSSGRFGRTLLAAMEEVLGRDGVEQVLEKATQGRSSFSLSGQIPWTFDVVSALHEALEALYGPLAAAGLARRIGRAEFLPTLREFGDEFGLTSLAFRMLPFTKKIVQATESLAAIFENYGPLETSACYEHQSGSNFKSYVLQETDTLIWRIENCPFCWERYAALPACQVAVGLLEEMLYWLSNGKLFQVEETECIACGAESCTIRFQKVPIG